MSGNLTRPLYPWFTALGLLLGCLVIAAYYKDQFREWKKWQQEYIRQEVLRSASAEQREMAARTSVEVKQIVLPELNRVDRCITCHIAVEDSRYVGTSQPLGYHPNHDQHPFEKFGCTICHQGQGRATTREAAHGRVEHWERPMLPMRYIHSSCAKCHQPSDIPEEPRLMKGWALFTDLGCIGCHRLQGVGGSIGPDLDAVGANRSPEWLLKHFKDPSSVSPGSAMPALHAGDEDLQALTLYILSFTGEQLGSYHVSMRIIPGVDVGRRLFEEKGCFGCHSVGNNGGEVGPALDQVTQRRTPQSIMELLRDPQAVTPGSVMPQFHFTDQEIRALAKFVSALTEPNVVESLKIPARMTTVERGKKTYDKYGCAGCHGLEGKGGVPNPNSRTIQIPGLKYVAETYTKEELQNRILNGQREIPMMDPNKPAPPLYMPAWKGKIQQRELEDLVEYLMNLMPQQEEEDW